MIDAAAFAHRRAQLLTLVDGPILLAGMGRRSRNLPMNEVPFRQDSTFLYFTGCDLPDAWAWIDRSGTTLYLPEPDPDDELWHGHVATPADHQAALGVERVEPSERLPDRLLHARPRTIAIADDRRTRQLERWTGQPLQFGKQHGDEQLVQAIIQLRRTKDAAELHEMRRAAQLTADAHRFVMRATRPGVHERALAALFQARLAAHGATTGYSTILTQRGEVLHNHSHDAVCEPGRLLLLDGGAELPSGYGADVTRTWPVSGRFSPRQRAAYEAVLEAQRASLEKCRAGVPYREVHDASSLVLARFLLDEGLLRGATAEQVVERGAHALFFPHGVGHLLGLDVHDLENFGDLPAYPAGVPRPDAFGTRNLRLNLPLEAGWVVTIEPGFYVVPSILRAPALRDRFADLMVDDVIASWRGFGGIRIEDDVLITADGHENFSASAPKTVDELESIIGTGTPWEELNG